MIEAADAVYDLGADRFYNDIEVCKIRKIIDYHFCFHAKIIVN